MYAADPLTLALAGMITGQSILALTILPVSRGDQQMRTALGIFFGALVVVEAFPLIASAAPTWAGTIFFLTLPAQLLCVPAFWLYIRETTALPADPRLGQRDLLHGGPTFFALTVFMLALFLDPSARVGLALDADATALDLEGVTAFGVILIALIWFAQLIGYGAVTIRGMLAHRRRLRDHFANVEGRELKWVTLLLAALGVYFAQALLLGLVLNVPDEVSGTVDGTATVILVSVLCLFGLRQGQAFEPSGQDPAGDRRDAPQTTGRYAKSALSRERSDRIAAALQGVMEKDEIYRDAELSLGKLAKAVATPPDYVTQTLNEILGESFFEFVNRWRIEAACRQLQGTTAPITEIALDVGYNSRSAFYRAFRNITGTTPSEYRRDAGKLGTVVSLKEARRE